ncbi:hypothetical protein [Pyrococcus horikoshii]|nr:hypothetical protein [Pyrococcus horikoshii]HII61859.1 hypothetical protein [Pyrococcus horikoshii]
MFSVEEGIRFKIRDALKAITALLIILWLFKGWLRLEAYNEEMVWAIITLIIITEILGVGRWIGITISGIILSLAKAAFLIAIFLFFGKWLDLPKDFPIDAKTAFAYSVVLGIAGILVAKFDFPLSKGEVYPRVEKKAYKFNGFSYGKVKLSGEGKAYPIKLGRKRIGWAIEGEVIVEADTPLGVIKRKLIAPVAIWTSINIASEKASPNLTFVDTANSLLSAPTTYTKEKSSIDLGILKVYEGEDFTYVKLPFLEVVETPQGEEVKIGPFKIREGSTEKPRKDMITIQELRNGFKLTILGERLTITTEDFKIETIGDRILYKSGEEKLAIGDGYVSLDSGTISISVGRDSGKIRIEDTVISASEGKVKIRIGSKNYIIESEEAFKLVLEKAREIVEEQADDIIEGLGIDRARLNRRIKELVEKLMEYI